MDTFSIYSKSSAQRQQQGDENDEPGGESCMLAVRSGRVR